MAIPLIAGGVSISAYGANVSIGVIALSAPGLVAIAAPIAVVGGIMIYKQLRDKSARDRAAAARRPP